MKLLSWKINKRKPERVVMSSYAIGKNVDLMLSQPPYTKLYLHSPMQYVWSHRQEYLGKFSGWRKKLFARMIPILQEWDLRYTDFDEVVFNSQYTQALAKEIYGITGKIQYPKIRQEFFDAEICIHPKEYFVCVGRLVRLVRECDVIIRTFNKLQLPLLMI